MSSMLTDLALHPRGPRTRSLFGVSLALAVLVASVSACSSDSHDENDHEHGDPKRATGSVCPDGSSLTYESFGAAFMETYCVRCHSSMNAGVARKGAPEDHDFDTLAGILAAAEHIDEVAAAGPARTNREMPPSAPKPSDAARKQLGEWLACELRRQ